MAIQHLGIDAKNDHLIWQLWFNRQTAIEIFGSLKVEKKEYRNETIDRKLFQLS